jgi:hypothetical protein
MITDDSSSVSALTVPRSARNWGHGRDIWGCGWRVGLLGARVTPRKVRAMALVWEFLKIEDHGRRGMGALVWRLKRLSVKRETCSQSFTSRWTIIFINMAIFPPPPPRRTHILISIRHPRVVSPPFSIRPSPLAQSQVILLCDLNIARLFSSTPRSPHLACCAT